MVKLLDTSHCSAELSDLVKKANKEIILVSPYLQISPRLLDLLKEASSRNISITLIYRNDKSTEKNSEQLNEQKNKLSGPNVKIVSLENLHAKCYLNESTAIITSMNLYQYSQENNIEFGVQIQKEYDSDLYNEVYNEIQRIYRISQLGISQNNDPKVVQEPNPPSSKKQKTSSTKAIPPASDKNSFLDLIADFIFGPDQKCYCIRCGTIIEGDPDKPFCKKCYSSWARFKNEDFAEKYCFSCGEEKETTYAKPICRKCYKSKVKK
ncbi:phospholipase D family protein [Methanimicrococcus blatticola]|uniref:Phospholipase D-like protein n=1 Tax=Methanimicrococcus blatticola TaxID=91560 RepID=A0A484F715_9EURY|nr:phospholipase D family protein [Methanimicrococcus blatticola]MBZ3936201.1 phospholipase D family protein [Methanimicrococcus blatticola]MCC2508444.1 phospholipase D family protein [Methanimicrococcus blatticola]TDQ70103.1 phospholipase D-like protein [Methanimicrococcus blatticola]